MKIKEIFNTIDRKIRLDYKSRSELSVEMGIRKQELSRMLIRLEKGQNISLDKLLELCNFLGIEVILKEKKNKKTK